jgi:hypothetical protein
MRSWPGKHLTGEAQLDPTRARARANTKAGHADGGPVAVLLDRDERL